MADDADRPHPTHELPPSRWTPPPPAPRASEPSAWGSAPPTAPYGVGGYGSLPPNPPVQPPPVAGPTPTPSAGGRGRGDRRGRSLLAVAAASAVLAGIAGGAVGVRLAEDDPAPSASSAVSTAPVTTAVPPIEGDTAEPVAAVAQTLGPAVVQIQTGSGLGSGFVYDESGLILTAAHVTDGAATVEVRMADGTRTTGEVLGSDDSTDVAVVRIEPYDGLPVAVLATGVPVQVGQLAVAIGSPFGLDQTVTSGIVSAVGRSVQTPGGVIPAIQTDAPINTGNSGGALADRQGRVIGINDSIVTGGGSSTGNLGVGFAIPIDIARSVADRIVAGEPTEAGFLGVEGVDASGARTGAAITVVSPGSPAAEAGLTESDVVVAVDGQQVSSMIDLAATIRTNAPGESVVLTVSRSGEEREVTVTLGTAPPP